MKKKILKNILIFFGKFTLIVLLIVGIILGYSWYQYERGYLSVDEALQERVFSGVVREDFNIEDSGVYRRTGNTFMSIPEWYIVTLSDDYTKWIEAGKSPTTFPYFRYLNDMWYIYGRITALMDGVIPRDAEYHTMVRVIGLSTTLEFGLKSLYENTFGRITSLFGYDTDEDIYYQKFSRSYVDFILLRPWYEFPFGEALSNFNLESYTPRSIERYLIYSFEFFMKMKYAKIIEDAAHANFAVPDIWTALSGEFSTGSIDSISSIQLYEDGIKIPRYYPFTQIFPQILENPANEIKFIAGNTHIVSEFLQSEYDKDAFIEIAIPIEPEKVRAFYYTDMNTLRSILSDPKRTPQHLYDF